MAWRIGRLLLASAPTRDQAAAMARVLAVVATAVSLWLGGEQRAALEAVFRLFAS